MQMLRLALLLSTVAMRGQRFWSCAAALGHGWRPVRRAPGPACSEVAHFPEERCLTCGSAGVVRSARQSGEPESGEPLADPGDSIKNTEYAQGMAIRGNEGRADTEANARLGNHFCSRRPESHWVAVRLLVADEAGRGLAHCNKPLRTIRGHPDHVAGRHGMPISLQPVDALAAHNH